MTNVSPTSYDALQVKLTLFITGATPRSRKAIVNSKLYCERFLAGRYELEIVDLYRSPERAGEAQIVATPTLVRHKPTPRRLAIGDLSDVRALHWMLSVA